MKKFYISFKVNLFIYTVNLFIGVVPTLIYQSMAFIFIITNRILKNLSKCDVLSCVLVCGEQENIILSRIKRFFNTYLE